MLRSVDLVDALPALALLVAAVLVLWLAAVALIWLHRPSRDLAMPVLRLVPDVVRLVRRLLADPATPRRVRILLVGLLLWLVSPIDLLPEFLPGIGALDDVIVTALVLRYAARRVGVERLRAHWPGTPEGFVLLQRLLSAA